MKYRLRARMSLAIHPIDNSRSCLYRIFYPIGQTSTIPCWSAYLEGSPTKAILVGREEGRPAACYWKYAGQGKDQRLPEKCPAKWRPSWIFTPGVLGSLIGRERYRIGVCWSHQLHLKPTLSQWQKRLVMPRCVMSMEKPYTPASFHPIAYYHEFERFQASSRKS